MHAYLPNLKWADNRSESSSSAALVRSEQVNNERYDRQAFGLKEATVILQFRVVDLDNSTLQLSWMWALLWDLVDQFPSCQGEWSHLVCVFTGPRAAGLSQCVSRQYTLHDDGALEGVKGIPPGCIWSRIPSGDPPVPSEALIPCWESRNNTRLKHRHLFHPLDNVGACQIAEIRERMSNGGQLPVQDAEHSWLRRVEDNIVDLVVPVDDGPSITGLGCMI